MMCALLPATFLVGYVARDGLRSPSPHAIDAPLATSIEVAFARDMSVHHSQAVDMGERIRVRTKDPNLRALSSDIVLTQQSQIGQFRGWLEQWRVPLSSAEDVLSSVSGVPSSNSLAQHAPTEKGSQQSAVDEQHTDRTMPGMAARASINQLTTAPLVESERAFLQLMIAHHEGGVVMSEYVLNRTKRQEVLRIAKAIIVGQTGEIRAMRQLLATRQDQP